MVFWVAVESCGLASRAGLTFVFLYWPYRE